MYISPIIYSKSYNALLYRVPGREARCSEVSAIGTDAWTPGAVGGKMVIFHQEK